MTIKGEKNILLSVRDLNLQIQSNGQSFDILKDISFDVPKGESVALIGDSGSGKSMTALALVKLIPDFLRPRISGQVLFRTGSGEPLDLLRLSEKARQGIRGSRIGVIFQDPVNSLNPLQRCGSQILESVRLHHPSDRGTDKSRVLDLLKSVGLENEDRFYRSYPHELSGGQLQRVLIAMALAGDPSLLIADEPTTNLDAEAKEGILTLLEFLKKEKGLSLIYITHDLEEAKRMADRQYFIAGGRIIREHPIIHHTGFGFGKNRENPKNIYGEVLLEARQLTKSFEKDLNFFGSRKDTLYVLDEVDIQLFRGGITGLVGPSGSGKTTLGRILLNLEKPDSGQVLFRGRNLFSLSSPEMRKCRRQLQIVYQNPYNTLNPRFSLHAIVREPLLAQRICADSREMDERAKEMLLKVGIPDEKHDQNMYQLSGGQRQRVAVARALVLLPEFVVLDECISSLDVRTQENILRLLMDLKEEFGLSYLFISHDMQVVSRISDRLFRMEEGKLKAEE